MFNYNSLSKMLHKTDTVSTLTIEERTDKTHGDIMKDVRKITEKLDIDPEEFLGSYKDAGGVSRKCYNLPRDIFDVVMSTYDVAYLYSVINTRNVM